MKRLIITLETSLEISNDDADYVTKNPCDVRLHIDDDVVRMSVSIKRGATDYHLGHADKGRITKMAIGE